jgi:predicted enzyme related to lactoylglutathione lyase
MVLAMTEMEKERCQQMHFDIPSDDIERSKKFYNDLFGWKIDKWPGSEHAAHDYWMITTTDDKGNEALRGGMMKRQSAQQQGITNFFDVKSIQEYSAKVEQLGGKVVIPKSPVPGMGYFAICTDTEDNGFAIWETDNTVK